MKNRLLSLLASLFFLLLVSSKANATNITGGIFSNTTWTAANSPYIILDSCVIFQGVTLTIDPGVVVEFDDNAFIDQRGTLIANGTVGDSITFTSSSATPYPGIYMGLILEYNTTNSYEYCKFSYAGTAIEYHGENNNVPITNSVFTSNTTGIYIRIATVDNCAFINNETGIDGEVISGSSTIQGCEFTCNGTGILEASCPVLNCYFSYNNDGIWRADSHSIKNCVFEYNSNGGIGAFSDTIENCTIQYNGIGISSEENYIFSNIISDNAIGIETYNDIAYSCNSICNNTIYNFVTENYDNISAADNYWCSTDTAAIQATIFDGHVNLNYGLVIFTPFDTSACSNIGSTLSISQITVPPLTVSTPAPICSGESTVIKESGASSYAWSPSTGLGAESGDSITAHPIVTTTYTVTGRATTCYGDDLSATVVVTVNPTPTITAMPNPVSICPGESSTLTASGAISYTWSPATALSATTGSSVTANPTVTITYTVTGTGSNGCTATKTAVVTVHTTPTIAAAPNPAIYCTGGSSLLTASGGITYTWSPATALSATTGSSVTANPTATTTYTVIDSSACGIDTTKVVVYVTTTLNVSANSPSIICSGTSVILSATGAGSYTWSPSAYLSTVTGDSVTATPTATTTYTVTGSSGVDCTGTATVVVPVNPTPAITLTANPLSYCVGGSSTLSASGATMYTWTPSAGLDYTTGAVVIATPTLSSTYTVTGTNTYGCSSTDTVTVTVNPNPTVTANANPATFCSGGISTLIASGANTYTWSPSTDLDATTGAIVAANPTITTTYVVIGTSSSGCPGTDTVVVTVNPTPTVTVGSNPVSYCSGSSSILTASGGNTYTWSPSVDLSATTGATITANPTETTTYTVTGTANNGCTVTNTVTVNVNPSPTITTSPSPTYCSGGNATLNAFGAVSYTWSPPIDLTTTTGATVTASPTLTTTYTVTGTNSNGCSATDTLIVTVNPNPVITASASPSSLCTGGISTLTASGGESYTWSPSTGLDATTGTIVAANPTETTAYVVIGTNLSGCQGTTTVVVTVGSSTTVTATASPSSYCVNGSATLTASGCQTYTWLPSTGLSDTTGATVTATPTVTTTYTIDGANGPGCTGTTTVTITVNPLPVITSNSPTVCTGDSATLTANGAATYTWTPTTGLSATTGSSVVANPSVTTTYYVTGTDALGCSATDTDVVTVVPSPNKPTFHQYGDTLISSSKYDNQWYRNDSLLVNDTSQDLIITDTGEYWVIVNNEVNGCSTASDTMNITSLTGVNQLSINNNQLSVYPNPFTNEVFIKLNSSIEDIKDWTMQLTDVLGRTLYSISPLNPRQLAGTFEIDLPDLPGGIYFITVINKTGRAAVPVVKE